MSLVIMYNVERFMLSPCCVLLTHAVLTFPPELIHSQYFVLGINHIGFFANQTCSSVSMCINVVMQLPSGTVRESSITIKCHIESRKAKDECFSNNQQPPKTRRLGGDIHFTTPSSLSSPPLHSKSSI